MLPIVTTSNEFYALYPSLENYMKEVSQRENTPLARLILVRHGDSEGNVERLIDGRTLDKNFTALLKADLHWNTIS